MKKGLVSISVIFMLIITSSCSKVNRYVNKEIGYEITGPVNWHMLRSNDKRSVSFGKYKGKKYGNSTINLFVAPLQPYFDSPIDYIENLFLPQVRHEFEEVQGISISLIDEPYTTEKGDRRWATVKYYVGDDTIQNTYITFSKGYIFMMAFSTVSQYEEDERLFFAALDSFVIY